MSFETELNNPDSHKIVLLEMDTPLARTWINESPGRSVFIVAPGSQDVIDDFGNVGYYGDRNDTYYNIQSVIVDGSLLPEFTTLVAWRASVEGWFYDTSDSKLYVTIEDYDPPRSKINVVPGAAVGFSYLVDDEAYYEDIYYEPRLTDVPNLTKEKDPLYYGILQFQTPSFTFNNEDGYFDTFNQLDLYNQPYRVFFTFDGLAYSEAFQVYRGRIKEFASDFETFTMIGRDPREILSRQLPVNFFSNTDATNPFYFAGLDDADDGTAVPIAFGDVINGRAYHTGSKTWTFADITYNAVDAGITVVDKDGATFAHTGTGASGTFATAGADTDDDLYVTFTQSNVENGLDVIADILANYEGIAYNSSNYDQVEWTAEKGGVKNIGLWIGKDNLMTSEEVVEQVCNDNQGIFDFLSDGRYTFRTLDDSRAPTHIIHEDEKLDDGTLVHPTDEILSSIKIAYSENLLTNQDRILYNKDYEDSVYAFMQSYREQDDPYKSRLTSKTDADALAVKIMEQSSSIPDIIDVSTKTQNIGLRILDNLIYEHVRQSGSVVVERSRYYLLGININLSDFELYLSYKRLYADDGDYSTLEGGDSTTDYDYYEGGDSTTTPDVTIDGGTA